MHTKLRGRLRLAIMHGTVLVASFVLMLLPCFATDESAEVPENLKIIMATGERTYDWLRLINKQRSPESALSFLPKQSMNGYSIEEPDKYNAETIRQRFDDTISSMPREMSDILLGKGELPASLPVADDVFLKWGYAIAVNHNKAKRWLSMAPQLDWLSHLQRRDLRGYYYLARTPDLIGKLNTWSDLPERDRLKIHDWIIDLCLNRYWDSNSERYTDGIGIDIDINACQTEVSDAEKFHRMASLYYKYLPFGKENYDQLFSIPKNSARADIVWDQASPRVMRIPFLRPKQKTHEIFVKETLENWYRYGDWRLEVVFTDRPYDGIARLELQAGSMDRTNNGAILLDSNRPLTAYLSKIALVHEFGHLLGFNDCYVEYYDKGEMTMVNYQADTTNFMCSLQGHFKKTHFDELKALYFRD